MIRERLAVDLARAVASLIDDEPSLAPLAEVAIEITDTKDPAHGEFASNLAMVASKRVGLNPRSLADRLAPAILAVGAPLIVACEVAGPGFLNLRLDSSRTALFLREVLDRGATYARPHQSNPQKINVEFVSVNPNGPITIGSGRGAAYGSALCNVLEAAGHTVWREYYINDGVNSEQMRLFAESVRSYVEGHDLPENGYKGDYVQDVAKAVGGPLPDVAAYQSASQEMMVTRQRDDLAGFNVVFDTWFSEQSLHDAGIVASGIEDLTAKGVADEEPFRTKLKLGKGGKVEEVIREDQSGAAVPVEEGDAPGPDRVSEVHAGSGATLWLRSTRFGDDMDRVLRRGDGRLTYIASDVAYHADKMNRPPDADRLITILGPDHHGYIGRLHAVVAAILQRPGQSDEEALAEARSRLQVTIYQLVRFLKEGKPAPMRKRDGNIYELRDLVSEIGKELAPTESVEEQTRIGLDVGRFFFLMRSHESALDFDLDTAVKGSDDNPVFYVQYAHARIRSVVTKAAEAGLTPDPDALALLVHHKEAALARKILDLPWEVARAAEDGGVHRLTTYATELARAYTAFYEVCRVIQTDEPELSRARLALCEAAATGLAASLGLLGISAPDRM